MGNLTNRVEFKGTLCVYRESSRQEYLSAKVTTESKKLFYPRCPKTFDKLIAEGHLNVKEITFIANQDGSNPRNAKLVETTSK